MWELDQNEGWKPKNWCFQTVVLENTLRVPWATRRWNQSILKEINPEYSLDWLMLKLKLQYFGHLMQNTASREKTMSFGPTLWLWAHSSPGGWVVVQLLSYVQLFATLWTTACQASLSFTISKFAQTHFHWVSDAIQPSHPLLPSFPLVLNLSQNQGLLQWARSSHQVARVLNFQL